MSGNTHTPPPPPPPPGGYFRAQRARSTEQTRATSADTADGTEQIAPVTDGGPGTAPMTAVDGQAAGGAAPWARPAPPVRTDRAATRTAPAADTSSSTGSDSPAIVAPRTVPASPPAPGAPAGGYGTSDPKTSRDRLGIGWWLFILLDVILVVVAVVLGVRAFSGGTDAQAAAAEEAVATESEEPEEPGLAVPVDLDGDAFRSPSSNILCEISEAGARCDIAQLNSEPATVDGCDGTVGYVVQLTSDGVAEPCVPADEQPGAAPDGVPALDYGDSREAGDVECVSSESGVSCTDASTGAGFNVARAGVTTF
ncbi:hypothetical protein [Paraoerskovia marina]|uniref:hypothetical protein n=1 Tax=Paraoerskovia marina TaxID=545619 RepID=UPI000693DD45|nr:hypothetical protein [Paraoerskovia marina]